MSGVTPASLRLVFPEFASMSDAQIQFAIDQGAGRVDSTWGGDQVLGQTYYAAHVLSLAQRAQNDSGQQIASERFGEISISYKTPQQPTAENPFDLLTTTFYGAQYLELQKLNFPAVAVI
jgi:hypothetical protein